MSALACEGLDDLVNLTTTLSWAAGYKTAARVAEAGTLDEHIRVLSQQEEPFRYTAFALLWDGPGGASDWTHVRILENAQERLALSKERLEAVKDYLRAYDEFLSSKECSVSGTLLGPLRGLDDAGVPSNAVLVPWNGLAAESVEDDGTVSSQPIISPIRAPFERVATQVLPCNWGRCMPALATKVSDEMGGSSGWTARVDETVTLGPGGIMQVTCELGVWVKEARSEDPERDPSADSTEVFYRLQQPNAVISRNEGSLRVYRYPELPLSYSMLVVEKTLQFTDASRARVFGDQALRTMLQIWISVAAGACQSAR